MGDIFVPEEQKKTATLESKAENSSQSNGHLSQCSSRSIVNAIIHIVVLLVLSGLFAYLLARVSHLSEKVSELDASKNSTSCFPGTTGDGETLSGNIEERVKNITDRIDQLEESRRELYDLISNVNDTLQTFLHQIDPPINNNRDIIEHLNDSISNQIVMLEGALRDSIQELKTETWDNFTHVESATGALSYRVDQTRETLYAEINTTKQKFQGKVDQLQGQVDINTDNISLVDSSLREEMLTLENSLRSGIENVSMESYRNITLLRTVTETLNSNIESFKNESKIRIEEVEQSLVVLIDNTSQSFSEELDQVQAQVNQSRDNIRHVNDTVRTHVDISLSNLSETIEELAAESHLNFTLAEEALSIHVEELENLSRMRFEDTSASIEHQGNLLNETARMLSRQLQNHQQRIGENSNNISQVNTSLRDKVLSSEMTLRNGIFALDLSTRENFTRQGVAIETLRTRTGAVEGNVQQLNSSLVHTNGELDRLASNLRETRSKHDSDILELKNGAPDTTAKMSIVFTAICFVFITLFENAHSS